MHVSRIQFVPAIHNNNISTVHFMLHTFSHVCQTYKHSLLLLLQLIDTDLDPVLCSVLEQLPNGVVTVNASFYVPVVSTVATYACKRGYFVEGNESRICQDNGMWTGAKPTCGKYRN